jgi:hypothetical protein
MLCSDLEKNYSFPGFTLLLGGIFQCVSTKQPSNLRSWDSGFIISYLAAGGGAHS